MYLCTVSFLCAGNILTAVTLSLLAIVYLDALCLSSDYQEASVLFCHPTHRVAKTTTIVTSLTSPCPSVAKCIIYLACSTTAEKVSPAQLESSRTVFQKFPWILGWLISASNYEHQQSKRKKETSQQIVTG